MQETEQQAEQKQKSRRVAVNWPNLETRAEKLERKRRRREMEYKSTGIHLVMANLSVKHPDYGMSPTEHLRAKSDQKNNS